MENKLILNLRLEVGDQKKIFPLMSVVIRKLKQLEVSGIEVEYFELRLRRLNQLSRNKEAYMKIDANNRTFTDSEVSSNWDEAIMNPCERIRQRFITGAERLVAIA
jgi:hypothetical protein